MHDKQFPAEKWEKLVNEERRQFQDVSTFLEIAKPDLQEIWLDFGCGPGYFALPLAQKVKKVFAADISEQMLKVCCQRAAKAQLSNIECVQIENSYLPLPDSSVDRVLMANVLHELERSEKELTELHRLLKPHGEIFVIDWKPVPTEVGPPLEHRLSVETAIQIVEEKYFQVVEKWDIYEYHYVLKFRKQQ